MSPTTQAWEFAKLVRAANERGDLVIAAGDFNSIPHSLAHRMITTYGGVEDSWFQKYPGHEDYSSRRLSAKEKVDKLGNTCDSSLNTWRLNRGDGHYEDPDSCRLDYIFFNRSAAIITNAKVEFTDIEPELGCSFSDHFGIHIDLILQASASSPSLETPLDAQIVEEALALTDQYYARQSRQKWQRIAHFHASMVVVIAFHIAVFWAPANWVSFIFMLVATLVAVTGVVDGLIGFVFGRWELAGLREFQDEMKQQFI